tara:strand:- start:5530 stop:5784 length:255 start_codon:yes stop_codon:yes gene_type:complete
MSHQKRKSEDTKTVSLKESDLAQQKMGDNALQGNDQHNVRNQRHAVPDVRQGADDIVESFEKLDKDVRAKRELGKGNRNTKNDE